MKDLSIRDKCSVNSNRESDTFVGLKCENGRFSVHFPLGFGVSDDDKVLRKDIILLLNAIASTTGKKESELYATAKQYTYTMFPIQAYLSVIKDYYSRGYYKERETRFKISKRGKIDWNRTIKTQKPYVQGASVIYCDFVVRNNQVNENELVSLIHEYCVYESFCKIGWLFTSYVPPIPRIKFNKKLFRSVLRQRIAKTFVDSNRKLFLDLLAIVESYGDNNVSTDFLYGTDRFEYVWESLIDKVYGIADKYKFFPRTSWIIDGNRNPNSCLEPDTIMLWNDNVYVLDAKYYKYGVTKRVSDLPESSSINKQITYGEYISENSRFRALYGDAYKVYNAFLMPFESSDDEVYRYAGFADSDWKNNEKSYEKVYGILIDVKSLILMSKYVDSNCIMQLAEQIDQAVLSSDDSPQPH